MRSSDTNADYLQYKVEICSTSDCSVILRTIDQATSQTGWAEQNANSNTAYSSAAIIADSQLASYFYQRPGLNTNTQYWWQAYAIDPGGSNTWSAASTISTFTTHTSGINIGGNVNIGGNTRFYGN